MRKSEVYNLTSVKKRGLTEVMILPIKSRQILAAIVETPAGKYLEATTRWDRFKDAKRPEGLSKWRSALGETAVILPHMQKFAKLGESFLILEGRRFNRRQKRELRLAFLIHDLGEAKIDGEGVGDISAALKTSANEKEEHQIALRLIDKLDLPVELRRELSESYRNVVMGEDKDLNFAFRALEYLEYLDTAMHAYHCFLLEDQGYFASQFANSEFLIGRVLAFDLPKILDRYAAIFLNSIGCYLAENSQVISNAFDFTASYFDPKAIMLNRPVFPGEDESFSAAFAVSRERWFGLHQKQGEG